MKKHRDTPRYKALLAARRLRRKEKLGVDTVLKYNKNAQLKCRYGITLEQYEQMITDQGGTCAICRKPFGPASRVTADAPVLDHNHITLKNRAMIHKKCNSMIGYANDDSTILRLAAEYLDKYAEGGK